ncbi:hypothetical protein Q5752_003165 [Cryptotrichosporon argae]
MHAKTPAELIEPAVAGTVGVLHSIKKCNYDDEVQLKSASKTLAERAFWKYIQDEKPSFDGVTICPPMVYGPVMQHVDKPEALNTSVGLFWEWFKGGKTEADIPTTATYNGVDVRDGESPRQPS